MTNQQEAKIRIGLEMLEEYIQANMEVGTFEPKPLQMVLQDVTNPDEIIPAYEDETGTYFMNSKDLRAIQHVGHLMKKQLRRDYSASESTLLNQGLLLNQLCQRKVWLLGKQFLNTLCLS